MVERVLIDVHVGNDGSIEDCHFLCPHLQGATPHARLYCSLFCARLTREKETPKPGLPRSIQRCSACITSVNRFKQLSKLMDVFGEALRKD